MKRIASFFIFALFSASAVWAISPAKEIKKAKDSIEKLEEDISYLKLSAGSLDSLYARLSAESQKFDVVFRERMRDVLVPLLHWPNLTIPTDIQSWLEGARIRMVMDVVQRRLVEKPLEMIADRELRLEEVQNMKDELASTLRLLESKESMLQLQVEELRMVQTTRRGLPHATKKQ